MIMSLSQASLIMYLPFRSTFMLTIVVVLCVLASAETTSSRSLLKRTPVLNYEHAFTAKIYTDQTSLDQVPADGGSRISAPIFLATIGVTLTTIYIQSNPSSPTVLSMDLLSTALCSVVKKQASLMRTTPSSSLSSQLMAELTMVRRSLSV